MGRLLGVALGLVAAVIAIGLLVLVVMALTVISGLVFVWIASLFGVTLSPFEAMVVVGLGSIAAASRRK